MVVKSVFTVISVNKTKIAYIGAQKVLQNFGHKRGEPIFQIWGGGKKEREPKFFQNPRGGIKALRTMITIGYGIHTETISSLYYYFIIILL